MANVWSQELHNLLNITGANWLLLLLFHWSFSEVPRNTLLNTKQRVSSLHGYVLWIHTYVPALGSDLILGGGGDFFLPTTKFDFFTVSYFKMTLSPKLNGKLRKETECWWQHASRLRSVQLFVMFVHHFMVVICVCRVCFAHDQLQTC
jgi:hypothetical protein